MTLFSILIYFVTKIDYQNCHLVNPIFNTSLIFLFPSFLFLLPQPRSLSASWILLQQPPNWSSCLQPWYHAILSPFWSQSVLFFFKKNKVTLLFKSFDALHFLIKLPLLVIKIVQSISCLILFFFFLSPAISQSVLALRWIQAMWDYFQFLQNHPPKLYRCLTWESLHSSPWLAHLSPTHVLGIDPGASSVSTGTAPSSML